MKKCSIVGENIRKLRLKEGLTQEGLALKSGLSQGYINHLENGRRNYTQKTLELISEALSVPVIFFFSENRESRTGSDQSDVVAAKETKKEYRKELNNLLQGLPEHVIEHYITLMNLEKELLQRERKKSPPSLSDITVKS
ncbi:MAG: helix-turn-helix transcriptional regulator [Syntrophales bacterium]|nr:helix-turn-helix transcriptional regulator [Syntrophales bacterium]